MERNTHESQEVWREGTGRGGRVHARAERLWRQWRRLLDVEVSGSDGRALAHRQALDRRRHQGRGRLRDEQLPSVVDVLRAGAGGELARRRGPLRTRHAHVQAVQGPCRHGRPGQGQRHPVRGQASRRSEVLRRKARHGRRRRGLLPALDEGRQHLSADAFLHQGCAEEGRHDRLNQPQLPLLAGQGTPFSRQNRSGGGLRRGPDLQADRHWPVDVRGDRFDAHRLRPQPELQRLQARQGQAHGVEDPQGRHRPGDRHAAEDRLRHGVGARRVRRPPEVRRGPDHRGPGLQPSLPHVQHEEGALRQPEGPAGTLLRRQHREAHRPRHVRHGDGGVVLPPRNPPELPQGFDGLQVRPGEGQEASQGGRSPEPAPDALDHRPHVDHQAFAADRRGPQSGGRDGRAEGARLQFPVQGPHRRRQSEFRRGSGPRRPVGLRQRPRPSHELVVRRQQLDPKAHPVEGLRGIQEAARIA